MIYSPRHHTLFSGSDDTLISYFESRARSSTQHYNVSILRQHVKGVMALELSRNDSLLFSAGKDSKICMYSVRGPKDVRFLYQDESQKKDIVRTLKSCSRGHFLFSGGYDQKIRVWRVNKREFYLLQHLWHHSSTIMDIYVSRNSQHMLSCGKDEKVIVWKINDRYKKGKAPRPDEVEFEVIKIREIKDNNNFVYVMAVDSQEEVVVTGSADFSLVVYDFKRITNQKEGRGQWRNKGGRGIERDDWSRFKSGGRKREDEWKDSERVVNHKNTSSKKTGNLLTWEKNSLTDKGDMLDNQISKLLENLKVKQSDKKKGDVEGMADPKKQRGQTRKEGKKPKDTPTHKKTSQEKSISDLEDKSGFSKEDREAEMMIFDIMDQMTNTDDNQSETVSSSSMVVEKLQEKNFGKKQGPERLIVSGNTEVETDLKFREGLKGVEQEGEVEVEAEFESEEDVEADSVGEPEPEDDPQAVEEVEEEEEEEEAEAEAEEEEAEAEEVEEEAEEVEEEAEEETETEGIMVWIFESNMNRLLKKINRFRVK